MRALLVIAALLAAFATGCGSESGEEAGPTGSAATTTTPTETAPSDELASRPRAPGIAGTTLDGERLSLAAFRGRPVLVNVWASW